MVGDGSITEANGYSFSKAVADYCTGFAWESGYSKSTVDNYRWMCTSFLSVIEDKCITKVTKEDLVRWRLFMDSENYDKNSVNSYLYKFRRIMRHYSGLGLALADNDIVIPKKRKPAPKFLTIDEIKLLIEHADVRGKAIIALLYSTGIRVGETEKLRRGDLRGDQLFIVGKGDKESTLILDEAALYYIEKYLQSRTDSNPYLFRSMKGGGLTKSAIQKMLRDLRITAGIQSNVSPHILRHSLATHLAQSGMSAFHLQRVLRHEHISSTQIYVHLSGKDIRDAYKKFHTSLI